MLVVMAIWIFSVYSFNSLAIGEEEDQGMGKTRHDTTRHGTTRHTKTGQGKSRQDKTRQDKMTLLRQDNRKTRQDHRKTRQRQS